MLYMLLGMTLEMTSLAYRASPLASTPMTLPSSLYISLVTSLLYQTSPPLSKMIWNKDKDYSWLRCPATATPSSI